jgi:hypothetical protein
VPVAHLTEVFRQAAKSRIIVNAHRINQGPMPNLAPTESGDFYFVDADRGWVSGFVLVGDGFREEMAILKLKTQEAGGSGARSTGGVSG